MPNEKERPTEERHAFELPRNQDVIFPIPLSRWETYEKFKRSFRDGSPGEVFFERGTDGKDLQELTRNQYLIMNMHISARNPKRKSASRGGSGPLISKDKSFAVETGQPHYVIETDK